MMGLPPKGNDVGRSMVAAANMDVCALLGRQFESDITGKVFKFSTALAQEILKINSLTLNGWFISNGWISFKMELPDRLILVRLSIRSC